MIETLLDIDEKMKPVFKGEILLCEDNEINQHVIKSHITQLGLYIVIAGNGKEGVDIVADRIKKGQKPFDLIFMDIQMPIMGGLEASDELHRLGNKTPVVAMTANATDEDRQIYKAHGMPDAVSKPIATKELWTLLHQYFTPLGYVNISDDELLSEEEKRKKKLFTSFAMKNQTTAADITSAIEAGDIKLAHRLAHTLRGLAGLMGKKALQESARVVELALAGGSADNLSASQLETLQKELAAVLTELSPYLVKAPQKERSLDTKIAAAVFDRLQKLLGGDDASCQELIEDLKIVPQTDTLISQIEEYEFGKALETLESLRKNLGV